MAKRSVILAVGGAAMLVAGGAVYAAGKAGNGKGNRFERLLALDQDQDKAVTVTEFTRPLELRFTERDRNKDGVLKSDEITFRRTASKPGADRAERLVKRFDSNQDGKVTAQEFEEGQKRAFTKRDKNGDGKISSDEAPRWFNRRGGRPDTETLDDRLGNAAQRFKSLDLNGDGSVVLEELRRADADRQEYRVKREMHRFDANGDGSVTPDEYMMPSKRRFSQLDLDSDGRITAEDLPPGARAVWTTQDP